MQESITGRARTNIHTQDGTLLYLNNIRIHLPCIECCFGQLYVFCVGLMRVFVCVCVCSVTVDVCLLRV